MFGDEYVFFLKLYPNNWGGNKTDVNGIDTACIIHESYSESTEEQNSSAG